MGVRSTYNLVITDASENDKEFILFKLLKASAAAKRYLDENGKSTGNEGYWDTLETDMRAFSKLYPDLLFFVKERWSYDGSGDIRHYFRDGQYKQIAPVEVWPEFADVEWT